MKSKTHLDVNTVASVIKLIPFMLLFWMLMLIVAIKLTGCAPFSVSATASYGGGGTQKIDVNQELEASEENLYN